MPAKVDDLFKEIKKENPSYTDEQAWATAWSVFCKHVEPGSDHCHKPTSEYMKSKAAAADADMKKVLARLATAKKAVAAMPESEAKQLSDAAQKLYKEAHDLFDEAHRTKADYYAPIDPSLVEQLRDLHGKVLKGLKFLSRIDARDASPELTKDLSTFGLYRLSPDTLSEAAGLASVIDDKARLVLYKARRAAQQVRFYTNWVDNYKATGASPSMEDQWKWLREASASNPLRAFQDALIVRNVVARFVGAMEHATPEAMKKYLHDHPDADAKNHSVKKQEDEKANKGSEGAATKAVSQAASSAKKSLGKVTDKLKKIVHEIENDTSKTTNLSGRRNALIHHEDEVKRFKEMTSWADRSIKESLESIPVEARHTVTRALEDHLREATKGDFGKDADQYVKQLKDFSKVLKGVPDFLKKMESKVDQEVREEAERKAKRKSSAWAAT